jgi:hypothetical protein
MLTYEGGGASVTGGGAGGGRGLAGGQVLELVAGVARFLHLLELVKAAEVGVC